jgi:hypothetical protein
MCLNGRGSRSRSSPILGLSGACRAGRPSVRRDRSEGTLGQDGQWNRGSPPGMATGDVLGSWPRFSASPKGNPGVVEEDANQAPASRPPGLFARRVHQEHGRIGSRVYHYNLPMPIPRIKIADLDRPLC